MATENSTNKEVRTEILTNMDEQELQTILKEEATMKDSESTEKRNQDPLVGGYETAVSVSIDSLVIDYHPRKNLGDLKSLMGSIKRDGLLEPLLAYEMEDGKVALIDGYRRLAAAKEFGWKEVPCVIWKKMSKRDAAHLSYVKNAERNAFDPIEIAMHLKAMMERFGYSMRDLEIKGYGSAASISNKLKLLEVAAPVQEKIRSGELSMAHGIQIAKLPTQKEQERMAKRVIDEDMTAKRTERQIDRYLSKGKQKDDRPRIQVPDSDIPGVYMKDSRDMSEMPDKAVHLIVTSPPYSVGMEYEKGVTFEEHIEMVQGVLKECGRVLVSGGVMAINVGDIYNFKGREGKSKVSQVELMGHKYQSWLRSHGIFLTDTILWLKPMAAWRKRPDIQYTDVPHTTYTMLPNFEPVYIFRKKGERETPSEEIVLQSKLTKEQWTAWTPAVWKITPVLKAEGHPCPYPEELCMRLIKMFSYEGDTVLDPWLGSGTTVKVARELNRVGIGYEKEPQYKEVIMKKLGTGNVRADFEGVRKLMKEMGLSPGEEQEVKESHEEEKEETVVEHAEGQLVMVAAA